jgi:hypothetical protein
VIVNIPREATVSQALVWTCLTFLTTPSPKYCYPRFFRWGTRGTGGLPGNFPVSCDWLASESVFQTGRLTPSGQLNHHILPRPPQCPPVPRLTWWSLLSHPLPGRRLALTESCLCQAILRNAQTVFYYSSEWTTVLVCTWRLKNPHLPSWSPLFQENFF